MSVSKHLVVNLCSDTLKRVQKQKLNLIIMQGTASNNPDSLTNSVVAKISHEDLFEQNRIELHQKLIGFITKSSLESGTRIDATTSRNINLGDTFEIAEDNASVTVIEPDHVSDSETFSFVNKGDETTVGYSVYGGENVSHVCAAPIPGRSTLEVMPLNKYLLYFTADDIFDRNYAITTLKGNAAVVEYEDHTSNREVTWDYHTGLWSKGSDFNAMYHPTNNWLTNLVSTAGSVVKTVGSAINSPLGQAAISVAKKVLL
ncbi:hypothetical protein [Vibrio campbellii]|uniref:hypothetical protein n=1 Tax=Vibrio campbellii TaxID=680 RepID=UPI0037351E48